MPDERFKTEHECPKDGTSLYEEETSLLHCKECDREYYTFNGSLRELQGADTGNYAGFTARPTKK